MEGFSLPALLTALGRLPTPQRYWVAYSGGCDSTVFLHALAGLREQGLLAAPLAAIHIDHGLQLDSPRWAVHCAALCAELKVEFQTHRVDARARPGASREDAARDARYAALRAQLAPGDMLLTAHHADDQAETLLMQALRGGGPHGLAAMPRVAVYAPGWLARPLLDVTRAALAAYAVQHHLRWVEDPSNLDTRYARNALRQRIMPALQHTWPAAVRTLARSARLCAEAAQLLDELADQDLLACAETLPNTLRVSALLTVSVERRRNALRRWVYRLALPLPSAAQLESILRDALNAAWDATPWVRWPGAELRRYRDVIYAQPPLPPHDPTQIIAWDVNTPLTLAGGELHAARVIGSGLRVDDAARVSVRFRCGGETLRLAGRAHTRELRKILQESGVPPWQRERIPLIYLDDHLAAIAGVGIGDAFHAGPDEVGWEMVWRYASEAG